MTGISIENINALKEYQIKSCKYEGIEDKNGSINQTSESGEEFNIIRFLEHKYTLYLQYLTFEECQKIIKELINAKNNRNKINILKAKIEAKGYIDFKKISTEPFFYFELKEVKPKLMTGKGFYEISIPLRERIDII